MNQGMIDLHLHTTASDGSDSPEELLRNVRSAGLCLFSITDHDAVLGANVIPQILSAGDPAFIPGVEFSCRDEQGKYHILGYGYDASVPGIDAVVQEGHGYRMEKLTDRLQFLQQQFGICFPQEEVDELYTLDNPGKPHIARLMVQHGYVKTIGEGISEYIDQKKFRNKNVRPETAIEGILKSGGIPILAHPCYGSGDELILGDEMDERLRRLMDFGLAGLEAFYSGFSEKLQQQMLAFAEDYNLYVTAGSDYHGVNKMIDIGDTNLEDLSQAPRGLRRFLNDVTIITAPA